MHDVIDQDHGAVKGFDGADLVRDRRIVGEGLNGPRPQIRCIDLIGVDGFGYGIGQDLPAQHLAERYTHTLTQHTGRERDTRHVIERGDPFQQPLVDHVRGERQDQRTRVETGKGVLQTGMSFGDHIPDTGVTGERFLDRGFHVPDQNQRGVHVHFQEGRRAFIAAEALTQEDVFQFIADAAAGVAHSINTLISQGFRDHFTEQQLGVIAMCGNVGQEKNTPRSTHADAVREGCILYRTVKLRGAEVMPGQSTYAGGIAPHQNDAVAGMFCIGHQSPDLTGQPGCGTVGWCDPVKRDLRDRQQRFILTIPQVEPVLIDEVLNGGIDIMGNITVLIHVFPDAAGADVFQFRRKAQLDQVAGHELGRLFGQGRLVRTQKDDVVHRMDGPGCRLLFIS